ncbi:hypothetical protein RclHR1_03570001 [Rhizophagus clarus]|uniref:Uncharacterized protein n=1 Tax=Rhizophagus clarus TaxID=94130 RepID=A0A2Z6RBQ8_9GLOM|nr:hypothetical protein RclHR1_03570001 [Rhizophagus clarus]GET02183.1 hypothetical protein GLOIN_2v1482137 [Rhizophagus clarus]
MDPNNNSTQIPVDQAGNGSVPLQIPSNIGISNPPNNVFEFYLPLPNDTRIYRVTYTELHPFEIARLLNNGVNVSHNHESQFSHHQNVLNNGVNISGIHDSQFSHHQNVQNFIRQQIHQQAQQHIYQPQQQPYYFNSNPQLYSDNNVYNNANPLNYYTSNTQNYF